MIGAIAGHAIAESCGARRSCSIACAASWTLPGATSCPGGQLTVIALASLVACAPALVITRLAAD